MPSKRFAVLAMVAAVLSLALPALSSAEEPAGPKRSIGFIDLPSTAIPVIWQGRLVNYIFVKCRLTVRPGQNASDLNGKLPYVRDALIRESHRTPLFRAGQFMRLDEATFARTVTKEAVRFIGPGVVTAVTITAQTPARVTGLPGRSPVARAPIP